MDGQTQTAIDAGMLGALPQLLLQSESSVQKVAACTLHNVAAGPLRAPPAAHCLQHLVSPGALLKNVSGTFSFLDRKLLSHRLGAELPRECRHRLREN